jgi:hypothetical protein
MAAAWAGRTLVVVGGADQDAPSRTTDRAWAWTP